MKLPQVSLRELFLLVALVAMGCGWWVRERELRGMRERGNAWRLNTLYMQYFAEQEGWIVDWRDGEPAPSLYMIRPQLKPLESGKGYAGWHPDFQMDPPLKNKPPE